MKFPNRIIKAGESDTKVVKAVQDRLKELGIADLQGTGIFGPKTTAAVKQFQALHRDIHGNPLVADGKIGPITWQVLFNIPVDSPPAPTGGSDLLENAVAQALSQVGVMENPLFSNRGREIRMYMERAGSQEGLFWCAGFVYWCFDEAALSLGRSNPLFKTVGCLKHWNNTNATKIVKSAATTNPGLIKRGSIFIKDHGGGMGHTGIVEKVENGFIQTIEGNSNSNGSSNGIGVFRLTRKINSIEKGFIIYS
ncbi:Putative peptidoglycan binding domain-containing protein [Dyadobacter sp. SG02]|uniref:CHAP domain-containing protein n=1 Tax=Dyadobacter sp. SG02 TaxID=1855291 RepID=UPI0008AB2BE7|nr:CHAP domain-containing protein [Dyadobacter sp. SG02]SEI40309.1 Putative peptidoglycan binding domain-containing protein [Dyadobacter sp. SG02]